MTENMIMIDGSMGEGGGQVLRASLALSMALKKPFHIKNIRSARSRPGLKRQHLTCVLAAQHICKAQVRGAEMGSKELFFVPGDVQPGDYCFDIGSGGSCSLVLQALLPPLLIGKHASTIKVCGGTHVPHAPSFDFLQQTLFPWLEKLGPKLHAELKRPGFMQVGGGLVKIRIIPVTKMKPLRECDCGAVREVRGKIMLYHLDDSIAKREMSVLTRTQELQQLGMDSSALVIERAADNDSGRASPGNAVLLMVRHESGVTVCTGIGQRGLSAQKVAGQVKERALAFIKAGVPVESHLADQLLVPLALAGEGCFLTEKPSLHTRTCLDLLPFFVDGIKTEVLPCHDQSWRIRLYTT